MVVNGEKKEPLFAGLMVVNGKKNVICWVNGEKTIVWLVNGG